MVHRLSYFLIIAPCYVELFPQYFNCKTHTKNIVLLYYAVTLEVIMKFGYFDDPNREYVITTPETPLPPITEKRAMELFRWVLKQYELAVYSNTRDDINQNQFDSLVSFTYNVGVTAFKNSTLLKRINTNASQQSIINAFMMWNKPKEIIGRRKREVELYFS